ncbi:MAG: hypothetical protein ACOH2E_01445 [Candidatus Paracaedibacter sp.]
MKRCFLSKIDESYSPNTDLVIGPWCFEDTQDFRDVDLITPFERDEILTDHRKCFDMAHSFLYKDMAELDSHDRDIFFLKNQKLYLYLVYILYSRFVLLKKFINTYGSAEQICFEAVEQPQGSVELDLCLDSQFSGWVIGSMLKILYPNKISWFSTQMCSFNAENNSTNKKSSIKESINNSLNYFKGVKGITPSIGIFFSFIYIFLSCFRKKKKLSIKLYNPKKFIFEDFDEFEIIFNQVKEIYSPKINFYKIKNMPKNIFYNLSRLLQIGTPSSIIYEENTSLQCIIAFIQGSKIIVLQHGSNYATTENHFPRELEYNFSSFISFGKKYRSVLERDNIVTTLPNPYMSSLKNKYSFSDQSDILWATCLHYKAGDGLQRTYGIDIRNYINKKIDLYHYLEDEIKKNIIYKVLPKSKYCFKDRLREILPSNQVVENASLVELMLQARILVLDYYGTPFYEAMSMNTPVVACFLESKPFFSPEAKEIMDEFKRVNVIYDTIEELAKFLNESQGLNIESWWNSSEIQSVRYKFLREYANNDPYLFPWLKAIIKGTI